MSTVTGLKRAAEEAKRRLELARQEGDAVSFDIETLHRLVTSPNGSDRARGVSWRAAPSAGRTHVTPRVSIAEGPRLRPGHRRADAAARVDPRRPRGALAPLRAYYRQNPAAFINDWGVTDPNADIGLPTSIPFVLFPRQVEWVNWVMEHWQGRKPGLTEKSRECRISWLAVALACTLCLFNDGITIGFGSRKEEYVDKLDSPKSLFFKARMFLKFLPPELSRRLESQDLHAPHMLLTSPSTGSHIAGEAGDGIGRGDRASIYFVDESAFPGTPAAGRSVPIPDHELPYRRLIGQRPGQPVRGEAP